MRILITGGAGFIGSNLAGALLGRKDVSMVRIMDNFCTGNSKNIEAFFNDNRFEFVEADIRDYKSCLEAVKDIEFVSHQAALGSVPRSILDPITTNEVNITGTLHIFNASREAGVKRVVYAASSSTYGDHPVLPKMEDHIGRPLSPYAVTKYVNELYAGVYANTYGMKLTGLRYFNVFGPRQNPEGSYAAVIPLFIKSILKNEPPIINGNGEHSRDFTYIANAVQANESALFSNSDKSLNTVFNVACGKQTSLNELFQMIKEIAGSDLSPRYGPERMGDVVHSLADIERAKKFLSYEPNVSLREGLKQTFEWYRHQFHYGYS